MASARLKIDEREIEIGEGPVTFGRSSDNTIPFEGNSNISRNHALIEFRDGAYHLLDLGSSNGTALNGVAISGDTVLNDGDYVTLGNAVIVQFFEDEMPEPEEAEAAAAESPETRKSNRKTAMLAATGAVVGLAVVLAGTATYLSLSGGDKGCQATARIVSPRNGFDVTDETELKIEVTDSACVSRVIVTLNGQEIASFSGTPPFTTTLNPDRFADLSDGRLYPLKAVIEDIDGNRIDSGLAVNLQFDTREIAEPTPTEETAEVTLTPTPIGQTQLTLNDTRTLTANVVRKFTGASARYNLSNPEFLQEVRKRTNEYAGKGYFERAGQYRDRINQSFVREKTLDPAVGFLLAMSRSKFVLQAQGTNEGLWQMSNDFVNANAYNVVCTPYTLSDPAQECASKVAAFYFKDLVDAYDGDIVYAVASFGKTAGEANVFKTTLPADRSDFWKVLTDANMRDQVARFFAAAIVTENPQRFGLKSDRPISELYPAAN